MSASKLLGWRSSGSRRGVGCGLEVMVHSVFLVVRMRSRALRVGLEPPLRYMTGRKMLFM
jgi:hypothetical protein